MFFTESCMVDLSHKDSGPYSSGLAEHRVLHEAQWHGFYALKCGVTFQSQLFCLCEIVFRRVLYGRMIKDSGPYYSGT